MTSTRATIMTGILDKRLKKTVSWSFSFQAVTIFFPFLSLNVEKSCSLAALTQLLQLWGSHVLYKAVSGPHQRDISISSLSKQPGETRHHISLAITYVTKHTAKRLLTAGMPGKVTIHGRVSRKISKSCTKETSQKEKSVLTFLKVIIM